jgi:uncharacterized protein (TIGR03067 family)
MSPLLVGLSLVVGAPALKDKPNPPDLYGEWEFEWTEEEGTRKSCSGDEAYRYRFNRDGTYQVFQRGEERVGQRGFTPFPKADPPALDLNTPPAGKNSPVVHSIFRVDGDRLVICDAGPGEVRPDVFAAPEGSGRYLIRFRRVKPKD